MHSKLVITSAFRLLGMFLSLCFYYSSSTGRSGFTTYGVNLFRFKIGGFEDLTIYSSTAIGFALLIAVNFIDRTPSKIRIASLALSALALASLANFWILVEFGNGLPFSFMFPIVIAVCELLILLNRVRAARSA